MFFRKRNTTKKQKQNTHTTMEICFGTQTHIISFPKDCAELQATIVHEIPELIPHQEKLQMHYIDDEGDDISVTTDDELQEAINCGSQNGGFLSLKLFVNGLDRKQNVKSKRPLFKTTTVRK